LSSDIKATIICKLKVHILLSGNPLWQGITDENGNLMMKIIILPLPLAGEGRGEGGTPDISPSPLSSPPEERRSKGVQF